jgi:hypothetical protein
VAIYTFNLSINTSALSATGATALDVKLDVGFASRVNVN